MVNEQTTLIGELALLRQNIEHIKEIIVMQQSYAKISGFVETVKISDLVEDALRMSRLFGTATRCRCSANFNSAPKVLRGQTQGPANPREPHSQCKVPRSMTVIPAGKNK